MPRWCKKCHIEKANKCFSRTDQGNKDSIDEWDVICKTCKAKETENTVWAMECSEC